MACALHVMCNVTNCNALQLLSFCGRQPKRLVQNSKLFRYTTVNLFHVHVEELSPLQRLTHDVLHMLEKNDSLSLLKNPAFVCCSSVSLILISSALSTATVSCVSSARSNGQVSCSKVFSILS